jgi:hypothetical protein
MKTMARSLILLACVFAVLPMTGCARVYSLARNASISEVDTTPVWIADRCDNICGLDDPRLLSCPAKVNYGLIFDATPEMKKLRDQGIDPYCPEGIQLRAKAADRVQTAADRVRLKGGYCSVWKRISHRDGRVIPDLTNDVLEIINTVKSAD